MNVVTTLGAFVFVWLVTFDWIRSWLRSREQAEPIRVIHSEIWRQTAHKASANISGQNPFYFLK